MQIKRTNQRFTKGIVNLPLIFNHNGEKIIEENGKPKVMKGFRYLFWEIDNQDLQLLQEVLLVYRHYGLSVYYHKSMRGYHFFSLKPMEIGLWSKAVTDLRPTNEMYPPITLRIKPNKYVNELKAFRDGFIHAYYANIYLEKLAQLRLWIERQNIGLINKYYYVVSYHMDNNDIDHKLTLKEREQEFLDQIREDKYEN